MPNHDTADIQNDAPYARTAERTDPPTLEGRLAKWELMPNMRVGAFSHWRENNQRAYATFDGSCICHHGGTPPPLPSLPPLPPTSSLPEPSPPHLLPHRTPHAHTECGGSIRAWLSHEKARPVVRWSTCNCTETQGLSRKVKAELPPRPSSYYNILCTAGAELVVLESTPSLEARATPLRCESGPVALSQDGRFFCGHGHEFVVKQLPTARNQKPPPPNAAPIKKKQRTIRRRFRTQACECRLALPNRSSFPELPLIEPASSEPPSDRD